MTKSQKIANVIKYIWNFQFLKRRFENVINKMYYLQGYSFVLKQKFLRTIHAQFFLIDILSLNLDEITYLTEK